MSQAEATQTVTYLPRVKTILGRRELSEDEKAELIAVVCGGKRGDYKTIATFLLPATLLFLWGVYGNCPLYLALCLGIIALLPVFSALEGIKDTRNLWLDAHDGYIEISHYHEPGCETPVARYETLMPRSQRSWTENGRPRRWRPARAEYDRNKSK